jgi:hypothetical protein
MKKVGMPFTPLRTPADKIAAHFISVLAGLKNIPHGCFGKALALPLRRLRR